MKSSCEKRENNPGMIFVKADTQKKHKVPVLWRRGAGGVGKIRDGDSALPAGTGLGAGGD